MDKQGIPEGDVVLEKTEISTGVEAQTIVLMVTLLPYEGCQGIFRIEVVGLDLDLIDLELIGLLGAQFRNWTKSNYQIDVLTLASNIKPGCCTISYLPDRAFAQKMGNEDTYQELAKRVFEPAVHEYARRLARAMRFLALSDDPERDKVTAVDVAFPSHAMRKWQEKVRIAKGSQIRAGRAIRTANEKSRKLNGAKRSLTLAEQAVAEAEENLESVKKRVDYLKRHVKGAKKNAKKTERNARNASRQLGKKSRRRRSAGNIFRQDNKRHRATYINGMASRVASRVIEAEEASDSYADAVDEFQQVRKELKRARRRLREAHDQAKAARRSIKEAKQYEDAAKDRADKARKLAQEDQDRADEAASYLSEISLAEKEARDAENGNDHGLKISVEIRWKSAPE